MTFLTMSAGQTLTVFNVRIDHGSGFRGASRNPWLWMALATTAVLEGVELAVPSLRDLLGLQLVPARAWLVAAGIALVPLPAIQAVRRIRDR